jgi:hypothetical protein
MRRPVRSERSEAREPRGLQLQLPAGFWYLCKVLVGSRTPYLEPDTNKTASLQAWRRPSRTLCLRVRPERARSNVSGPVLSERSESKGTHNFIG